MQSFFSITFVSIDDNRVCYYLILRQHEINVYVEFLNFTIIYFGLISFFYV